MATPNSQSTLPKKFQKTFREQQRQQALQQSIQQQAQAAQQQAQQEAAQQQLVADAQQKQFSEEQERQQARQTVLEQRRNVLLGEYQRGEQLTEGELKELFGEKEYQESLNTISSRVFGAQKKVVPQTQDKFFIGNEPVVSGYSSITGESVFQTASGKKFVQAPASFQPVQASFEPLAFTPKDLGAALPKGFGVTGEVEGSRFQEFSGPAPIKAFSEERPERLAFEQEVMPDIFDFDEAQKGVIDHVAPEIKIRGLEEARREGGLLGPSRKGELSARKSLLKFFNLPDFSPETSKGSIRLIFPGFGVKEIFTGATAGFLAGGFKPRASFEARRAFPGNEFAGPAAELGIELAALGVSYGGVSKLQKTFFKPGKVSFELIGKRKQIIGVSGSGKGVIEAESTGTLSIDYTPKALKKLVGPVFVSKQPVELYSTFQVRTISRNVGRRGDVDPLLQKIRIGLEENVPAEKAVELPKAISGVKTLRQGLIPKYDVDVRAEAKAAGDVLKSQLKNTTFEVKQQGIVRLTRTSQEIPFGVQSVQESVVLRGYEFGKDVPLFTQQIGKKALFGPVVDKELLRLRKGVIISEGASGKIRGIRFEGPLGTQGRKKFERPDIFLGKKSSIILKQPKNLLLEDVEGVGKFRQINASKVTFKATESIPTNLKEIKRLTKISIGPDKISVKNVPQVTLKSGEPALRSTKFQGLEILKARLRSDVDFSKGAASLSVREKVITVGKKGTPIQMASDRLRKLRALDEKIFVKRGVYDVRKAPLIRERTMRELQAGDEFRLPSFLRKQYSDIPPVPGAKVTGVYPTPMYRIRNRSELFLRSRLGSKYIPEPSAGLGRLYQRKSSSRFPLRPIDFTEPSVVGGEIPPVTLGPGKTLQATAQVEKGFTKFFTDRGTKIPEKTKQILLEKSDVIPKAKSFKFDLIPRIKDTRFELTPRGEKILSEGLPDRDTGIRVRDLLKIGPGSQPIKDISRITGIAPKRLTQKLGRLPVEGFTPLEKAFLGPKTLAQTALTEKGKLGIKLRPSSYTAGDKVFQESIFSHEFEHAGEQIRGITSGRPVSRLEYFTSLSERRAFAVQERFLESRGRTLPQETLARTEVKDPALLNRLTSLANELRKKTKPVAGDAFRTTTLTRTRPITVTREALFVPQTTLNRQAIQALSRRDTLALVGSTIAFQQPTVPRLQARPITVNKQQFGLKPLTTPRTIPFTTPITRPITRPVTFPISIPKQVPRLEPRTQPITIPTVTPTTIPTTIPTTVPKTIPFDRPIPRPVIGPPLLPPDKKTKFIPLPIKGFKPGFIPVLFRRGKALRPITKEPLTVRDALAVGSRFVDQSIKRSFKLVRAGFAEEKGLRGPTNILRRGKRDPFLFVEKSRFAISTSGEKFALRVGREARVSKLLSRKSLLGAL